MKIMKRKILLIHGWNYTNYTSSGCIDAWSDRSKFVEILSQHFDVMTINLPGFCGQADPERAWTLDDFVQYVGEIVEKKKPDCILGYSFGGAIVLRWKKISGDTYINVFLVSPAILRRYKNLDMSLVQKVFKIIFPNKLISILRDFYLVQIVKNPYYVRATKVMRETYRNIVVVDVRQDLLNVSVPLTLIYGEQDTATPPNLVRETLTHSQTKHDLHVISGGGHDIANSHTEELVSLIADLQPSEVPSSLK